MNHRNSVYNKLMILIKSTFFIRKPKLLGPIDMKLMFTKNMQFST
jgi:hypothetical protein